MKYHSGRWWFSYCFARMIRPIDRPTSQNCGTIPNQTKNETPTQTKKEEEKSKTSKPFIRFRKFSNPMRKSTSLTGWANLSIRIFSAAIMMMWAAIHGSAQCTLGCNDLVQFSLDEDCYSEVLADHILEAPFSCPGPKTVTVMGPNGQPIPGSPWVSGDYIGQTLTVKVTHNQSGNHCWGSILVEDKLAPVLNCPDVTLWCNNTNHSPAYIGYPDLQDNCDLYPILNWSDQLYTYNCSGDFAARIDRVWTATDASGNVGTCTQRIYFQRADLGDVQFPLNLDDIQAPALLCPNPNTDPSATGWPTVDGIAIGGFCDLTAAYSDQETSMCQGNRTIFRSWTVMDMCSGTVTSQIQVIKVVDKSGPTLICPTDPEHQVKVVEYLSGPGYNGCLAVVKFPQIQIADNCSSYTKLKFSVTTTINGFVYSIPTNGGLLTLPLGTHTIVYKATDDCGNASECSFSYTVIDKVPPVTACETFHTVALSSNVTLVEAITFDDGSYDQCTDITFQARRIDNPKCPGNDATELGPTVPFYCCDIANGPVMVTLRVSDAYGNWNECMTLVEVVDKVAPHIWCPKDITVACSMPYVPTTPQIYSTSVKPNVNISSAFAFTYNIPIEVTGIPAEMEIIDLDVSLDIKHEYLDQLKISLVSPKGTLVRLFDGGGCGIGKEDILATFNDEGANFLCTGTAPSIQGNIKSQADLLSWFDGEGLNSITVGNNKYNWILVVEDTAPIAGGKINEVGLHFTYGGPLALRPIAHDNTDACGLTITWEDLNPADKCPNGWVNRSWTATDAFGLKNSCTQRIYFADDTPWEVTFPEDVTVLDCTDINDLKNLGAPTHNGDCEMVGVDHVDKIFKVVPDACYKIERTWYLIDWCKYNKFGNNTKLGYPLPHPKNLKYRDDGDGYFEWVQVIKVMDNTPPKIFCPNDVTVLNMEADCGPTYFSPAEVVVLDCSPSVSGTISIDLFDDGSVDIIKAGLIADGLYPIGKHRISIKVEDGCNNFSVCEFYITVRDGKKPQASCKNINIDLMAMNGGGMAQITPAMLNVESEDNCTPKYKLVFDVQPKVFTCDNLGPNEVIMSVTDEAGNTDLCIAIVNVQDNMNVCPGNINGNIHGMVQDASQEGVQDVEVAIANLNNFMQTTGQDGMYAFNDLTAGNGYIIQPVKDNQHLNGVSTYDLLLIQKHLLGIKALANPYRIIAADVNDSKSVTIADIIDLRKSILNATPFANNTSWRFIDATYAFQNPSNPLKETFPEYVEIKSLPQSTLNVNFIGVKIGDVSGDATPNNGLLSGDTRNSGENLAWIVKDEQYNAAASFDVPVYARDLNRIEGFQFTVGFDKAMLQFEGVTPGSLTGLSADNFGYAFTDEGYLTTSWNGDASDIQEDDVVFTLHFSAKTNVVLSEALSINSMYLTAEAYDAADNLLGAELRFQTSNGELAAGNGFQLYQNRPNPFRDETIIGFDLPESGRATLTVTDVSGRVLKVMTGDFFRGYNEFRIQRNEFNTSGMVWYRLTADGYAATKQMIIVD